MQRKLSEIAEIPILLQSTLESVTRTFEQFLPPDPVNSDNDQESGTQDDLSEDEILSEADSLEINKIKEETPESDYVSEEDERELSSPFQEDMPELASESEPEECPTPEPTEEELIKKEKQQKIKILEKSWPWADRQKIIYKASTCHLVNTRLSIVENRIKQLAEQNLESILERPNKDSPSV